MLRFIVSLVLSIAFAGTTSAQESKEDSRAIPLGKIAYTVHDAVKKTTQEELWHFGLGKLKNDVEVLIVVKTLYGDDKKRLETETQGPHARTFFFEGHTTYQFESHTKTKEQGDTMMKFVGHLEVRDLATHAPLEQWASFMTIENRHNTSITTTTVYMSDGKKRVVVDHAPKDSPAAIITRRITIVDILKNEMESDITYTRK